MAKDKVTAPAGGLFRQSLLRNNSEIRQDRAESLADDARTLYRRQVEDLELEIRQMRRQQEDLLDLSPTTADSLVLAADFNAEAFTAEDLSFSVKIRNLEIKQELAKARYQTLFGTEEGTEEGTQDGAAETEEGE